MAPDVFYQVYTINGVIENTLTPIVFALLPSKTEHTYEKDRTHKSEKVVFDFEAAVCNAIETMQPDTNFNFVIFPLGPGSTAQCTKSWICKQVPGR